MNEIWRPIDKCVGYLISDKGHVKKSGYKMCFDDGSEQHIESKLIQPRVDAKGFLYVNFSSKSFAIHQLVASAFLTEPAEPSWVVFKDGDKSNCCASNLEWRTISEIAKQNIKEGRRKPPTPYGGLKIRCVDSNEQFASIQQVCNVTGLSRGTVTKKLRNHEMIKGKTYEFI